MAFAQKLALRQSQSLVMTPQLSQSIKLLTMSNVELTAFIETELEKNPFLELEKSKATREDGPTEFSEENISPKSLDLSAGLETDARKLSEQLGTDVENAFPDDPSLHSALRPITRENETFRTTRTGLQTSTSARSGDTSICDTAPHRLTLAEHLGSQLALAAARPDIHAIATHIIGLLDEAGYLRDDESEISRQLNAPKRNIETALALVQTFEPVGVGARDLAECLALQIADRGRLDPAIQTVLDNIDLLAKRDFASLRQITGLDLEDLTDILSEIRALEPRPGTLFSDTPAAHIVPDVIVTEKADGSWHVELNAETLPRVLVNNEYAAEVGGQVSDEGGQNFVSDCLQNATWLTRSLDQRAQTILKVASEIVKKQDAFLVNGVRDLKPLTLQAVADEIGMHESSVSRVTTGKFMATPRGMFELKYFFTTAIPATGNGDMHSSEAVRARIRSLIDAETAKSVLSDDAIVMELERSGINIARRTVAKYRDTMQIASSVQRRREKRAIEAVAK